MCIVVEPFLAKLVGKQVLFASVCAINHVNMYRIILLALPVPGAPVVPTAWKYPSSTYLPCKPLSYVIELNNVNFANDRM